MKSILGLLLITILATAATANYEYNSTTVGEILEDLHALKIHKAKVDYSDKQIQWEFIEDYNQATLFEVKNSTKTLGQKCGGAPTVVIDKEPIHCLAKMVFKASTVNGKKTLKLGLVVENSKNPRDWKIILSDLFKAPQNKAGNLPGVVYVDPMTKEQVARAVFQKSFVGPTSWIKILIEKGIYSLKSKSEKKSREVYMANPTVMDEEILNEVLGLLSKNTENDAPVETPQNDTPVETPQNDERDETPQNGERDEITDTMSVKQLVNFWSKAQNQ